PRPDRSHLRLRRHVARRRLHRSARGAFRRTGHTARSVPGRGVRRRALRHCRSGRRGADGGRRRWPRDAAGGGPMIRINLLPTDRDKGAGRRSGGASFDIARQAPLIGSVLLLATVLGIGWWWWMLGRAE